MRKNALFIAILLSSTMMAQNPVDIVTTFGNTMSQWCETSDADMRDYIVENLAGGMNGTKKCLVDDEIMDWISLQDKYHNTPLEGTRELATYLNGFERDLIGSSKISYTNFKEDKNYTVPSAIETKYELPLLFVTADVTMKGEANIKCNDRFFVRGGLITKIISTTKEFSLDKANRLYTAKSYEQAFNMYRKLAYADRNNIDAQYYMATMEILKQTPKGFNKGIRDLEACFFALKGRFYGHYESSILAKKYVDSGSMTYSNSRFNKTFICCYPFFSNGLTPIRKKDKFGMVDSNGNVVIPIQYKVVTPFNAEGWACVIGANDKRYFIDRNNKKMTPEYKRMLPYTVNGLFVVQDEKGVLIFDKQWNLKHEYPGYTIDETFFPLARHIVILNEKNEVTLLDQNGIVYKKGLSNNFTYNVKNMFVKFSDSSSNSIQVQMADWKDISIPGGF